MNKTTLDLIHRTYVAAVEKSENILQLVENFYNVLSTIDNIPDEDALQFDAFLKGIHRSMMIRQKTFDLTNLVSEITFVIMYIIIWLNSTKDMNIDINFNARRKSLESELEKILEKSYSDEAACIHDRFGLRGIILNDNSYETLIEVTNYIIGILLVENRKEYNLFTSWINENNDINEFTKARIEYTLNLPFNITNFKDFVSSPKENGYQSLHYVLTLDMFSNILPGAELEIQMRTNEMHQNAINGTASFDDYKKNRRTDKNIFVVEDFSKVSLIGFSSYDSIDDDIDGIHHAKIFVNRRISSKLV